MEWLFIIIVVILIILAISDLVVGVSNDAVNFINSAVGSKAAAFRTIMIIAAFGVMVGATFSSGMMEVARKGIFNPEHFYFKEIMFIFLAVMITDVLLLDLFNTAGLPTSTTVSLVFELLGAAFAVSTIKIIQSGDAMAMYATYINTGKVFAIISGILLSIAIGFTVAAIIQYIVRVAFTFDYKKKVRYFGAIWGGVAFAALVYFLFIKGAKGSSILTPEIMAWFKENTFMILLVSFLGSAVLFQLLIWIFKFNILKIIVLAGTFALAMAFAGNDLVNFIGVPLAGLESFQIWQASGEADPNSFSMEMLRNPVQTPTILLLIAGAIMVITLFISKKARSVTKTTIDLGRQDEGEESFQSSMLARGIVAMGLSLGRSFSYIVPKPVSRALNSRFQAIHHGTSIKDKPAFDMVRASVILIVSSILITIGTNLKLPLSTTYVTFMVAMGASLADRAWGRESAVYRISGVITVIGGWFFTALIAFTVSGLIALLIYFGGLVAIICLILLALFFVYRTHVIHKNKTKAEETIKSMDSIDIFNAGDIYHRCETRLLTFTQQMPIYFDRIIRALLEEKRGRLLKIRGEMKSFNRETKAQRKIFSKTIKKLADNAVEAEVFHMQVFERMKEIQKYMQDLFSMCFNYVDNSHPAFDTDEKKALLTLSSSVAKLFETSNDTILHHRLEDLSEIISQKDDIEEQINDLKVMMIRKLKREKVSTRRSMAMIDILTLSSTIVDHLTDLIAVQRKFRIKIDNLDISG